MMHYWRIPSTVFETWGGLLLKVEAVNFVCLVNIALLWKLSRGAYSEVRRVNFRVLVEQIQMYYWNSCRENNLLWALAWLFSKAFITSQPTPHVELTASTGQVQVSRYLTACRKEVCTCYTTFQGMLKSTVRILDTLYHLFKHSLARFAHSCVYYIAAGLSKRRKKCPSNSRLLLCARSVMPAPTLTPLISLLFYACSSRG